MKSKQAWNRLKAIYETAEKNNVRSRLPNMTMDYEEFRMLWNLDKSKVSSMIGRLELLVEKVIEQRN